MLKTPFRYYESAQVELISGLLFHKSAQLELISKCLVDGFASGKLIYFVLSYESARFELIFAQLFYKSDRVELIHILRPSLYATYTSTTVFPLLHIKIRVSKQLPLSLLLHEESDQPLVANLNTIALETDCYGRELPDEY